MENPLGTTNDESRFNNQDIEKLSSIEEHQNSHFIPNFGINENDNMEDDSSEVKGLVKEFGSPISYKRHRNSIRKSNSVTNPNFSSSIQKKPQTDEKQFFIENSRINQRRNTIRKSITSVLDFSEFKQRDKVGFQVGNMTTTYKNRKNNLSINFDSSIRSELASNDIIQPNSSRISEYSNFNKQKIPRLNLKQRSLTPNALSSQRIEFLNSSKESDSTLLKQILSFVEKVYC